MNEVREGFLAPGAPGINDDPMAGEREAYLRETRPAEPPRTGSGKLARAERQEPPRAERQEPPRRREPEPPPPAEGPAATQEPPAETWPITVKLLHKPTRNNKNEPINELTFREPTGGDINRYGNPVRINQDGDVIIDERKMTMIISSLSGVLLPFVEQLDPRDWNSCAYRLRGFFLPDPAAW